MFLCVCVLGGGGYMCVCMCMRVCSRACASIASIHLLREKQENFREDRWPTTSNLIQNLATDCINNSQVTWKEFTDFLKRFTGFRATPLWFEQEWKSHFFQECIQGNCLIVWYHLRFSPSWPEKTTRFRNKAGMFSNKCLYVPLSAHACTQTHT